MLILADSNPTKHISRPYVNYFLIFTCIALFFAGPDYRVYGFSPVLLHEAVSSPGTSDPGLALMQLFSYTFLHADIFHLAGNMLVLWIFGDNVEDSMGHGRYGLFFLLCGMAGALGEGTFTAIPEIPVVGASGAVSGVMGAYLLLHPRARVLVLVAFRFPVVVPASLMVGLYIGMDVVSVLWPDPESDAMVAFWAHLGGFAAGVGLLLLMRHPDVPLFQPASMYPERAFGRLGRFILDLGHKRDAGTRPAHWRERLAFGAKTLAYFLLVAVAVEMLLG